MGILTAKYAPLAGSVAGQVLGKPNPELTSRDELRYGNNGSLVANIAGPKAGTWHDFETGEHGDLIDLLIREYGMSWSEAKAYLDQLNGGIPAAPLRAPVSAQGKLKWSDKAEAIWSKGKPIARSVVESYLRKRGCFLPDVLDLRYLPATDKYLPAMVARITDFVTGDPLTLHFTRINPDTLERDSRVFLRGHTTANGIARLRHINRLDTPLGLAEGIEDALSVMSYREHGLVSFDSGPVWAVLSAGNLAKLPPTPTIGDVNVYADADDTGRSAAESFRQKCTAAGHRVRVMAPNGHKDWNDDLRAELTAAVSSKGGVA
jgi:hypothetical protein